MEPGFKEVAKRFSMADITRHRHRNHKNLHELITRYPSGGRGFRVWMKEWPENSFITIRRIQHCGPRTGRLWGTFVWEGEYLKRSVVKVRDALKKGLWNFDPKVEPFVAENGQRYDIARTEQLV